MTHNGRHARGDVPHLALQTIDGGFERIEGIGGDRGELWRRNGE
jgi:hypothetical protein